MILPQVPVRFHAERTAIFVAKPSRDSRNIHAALDANGREEVSQIVMSNSLHSDLCRGVRHTVLAFENAHDGCSLDGSSDRSFLNSFNICSNSGIIGT